MVLVEDLVRLSTLLALEPSVYGVAGFLNCSSYDVAGIVHSVFLFYNTNVNSFMVFMEMNNATRITNTARIPDAVMITAIKTICRNNRLHSPCRYS